jgi:putative two-component system response regulator
MEESEKLRKDAEDIEPVELEEVHESFDDAEIVLNDPHIRCIVQNQRESTIPFLLLDNELNVLHTNHTFVELFGNNPSVTSLSLASIFTSGITPQTMRDIAHSLKSPTSGYSWRGRVETHTKNRLPIVANLIIHPLYGETGKLKGYEGIVDNITEENRELLRSTFVSLLEASKLKDNDTGNHIKRVGEYVRAMAERLYGNQQYPEIDREFIDNIHFLAPMHDVGKIGTPDDILNKEGPLEDWEWEIMKEHTINGAYILSSYPVPMAKTIALFHHERWDGSGYPYKVAEKMIPLPARLVSIADVYDALRMKRSYKEPYSHEATVKVITTGRGRNFDPDLVDQFLPMEKKFEEIFEELKDN